MPSSTSSSDMYRDIPDAPWPRMLWIAAFVVAVLIVGWELLARKMHHEPGTYQTMMTSGWAEERRVLDDPDHDVRVVLIGSSRILWASDLDILEAELGTRPLQLALPGTSPALFFEDIVNNTDFDGVVLIGVTPLLFNQINTGVFGGDALDRYHNESPSQWIGARLHNQLSEHVGFLDESFSIFELMERYTDFPDRPGATNVHGFGWKLGNFYADRQTDMWAPVEIPGSFDNVQVTNFWLFQGGLSRPPPPEEAITGMKEGAIAFFTPLVEQFRERGGEVVFVRMPSSGRYFEAETGINHRDTMWLPMMEGIGAPWVNTMDHPELSTDLEIPEWSHFDRASQDLWSARIVPYLETAYREHTGAELRDHIAAE